MSVVNDRKVVFFVYIKMVLPKIGLSRYPHEKYNICIIEIIKYIVKAYTTYFILFLMNSGR